MNDDYDDDFLDDEEDDVAEVIGQMLGVSLLLRALMSAGSGSVELVEVTLPEPIEDGVARFVRNVYDDTDGVGIYQMDPPFNGCEHVVAVRCENGCCAHLIPAIEDPEGDGGYSPDGGRDAALMYRHATYMRGSIAELFARFGYQLAARA